MQLERRRLPAVAGVVILIMDIFLISFLKFNLKYILSFVLLSKHLNHL